MNTALFPKFIELYKDFRSSDMYKQREKQFHVVKNNRAIIVETLKNEPLRNEHLTGLIQLFKFGCTKKTFDKYLKINVVDASKRKELTDVADLVNEWGYTGAGKNAITDLSSDNLGIIKSFIQKAFDITSIEEAEKHCMEFDKKMIPQVKPGIYSPWLYYINPEIFPIVNNSHKKFMKWIDINSDYPSCIKDFNILSKLVNEKELGLIDMFAHRFEKIINVLPIKKITLSHQKIFKVSMSPKSTEVPDDVFNQLVSDNLIAVSKETRPKAGAKISQGLSYMNEMKKGDYFYLCRGNNFMVLVGRITGEPEVCFDERLAQKGFMQRKFEKIAEAVSKEKYQGEQKWWTPNDNSTFIEISEKELELANTKLFVPFFNLQFEYSKTNSMNLAINTILYGPPGTGKTYHTIERAVRIVNPAFKTSKELGPDENRKALKEEFERLKNEGQIVFTTFHQSMSYEDFIEGIKPIEPKQETQQLGYQIVDGIFKKACAVASFYCYDLFTKSKPSDYTYDDLYDSFIEFLKSKIQKKQAPIFKSLRGKDVEVKEINSNDSIIARAKNSVAKKSAPLTKENIQKLYDTFDSIEEIKDLSQIQKTVQVTPRKTEFYAVFSGLKSFEKNFSPEEPQAFEKNELISYDIEEIQKKFNAGVYNDAVKKFGKQAPSVVIIIDEINRGNVSQIFGELITLIEEDKRLGNLEDFMVTLPYSKMEFSVPPNLFIIGTMNTADRSVEALDTALRRRFSFVEMAPEYNLKELDYEISGYKAREILSTINRRIEKLLDRDHAIGHSYFMLRNGENKEEKFHRVFYNNLIPLLQEYFFGDYSKIGLVLGKGFVTAVSDNDNKNIFADFDTEIAGDFEDRQVYEIIKYKDLSATEMINSKPTNFEGAIELLMNSGEKQ